MEDMEKALEKSPLQLTADDVYDISTVLGRDLMQLSTGPHFIAARGQLQYKILRVLEILEVLVIERQRQQEQNQSRSAAGGSSVLSSPAAKSGAGTDFVAPSAVAVAKRGAKGALAETEGEAPRDETEAGSAAWRVSGVERERGASSTDSTARKGVEGETAQSLLPSLASAVRDYGKTGAGGVASSAPARQPACSVQRDSVARAVSDTKIAESRGAERHSLPAFPSPAHGRERENPLLVWLLSAVGEEALCHLYNAELRAKLGRSGPGGRKASSSLPPPRKAKKGKLSLCPLIRSGAGSVAIETPCKQSRSIFWEGELEHCPGPPIPGRSTPGTVEVTPVSAAPLGAASEAGIGPGGQHCTAGTEPGAAPTAALDAAVSMGTQTTVVSTVTDGTVPLRASMAPPKRAREASTDPGSAPTAKTLTKPTAGGPQVTLSSLTLSLTICTCLSEQAEDLNTLFWNSGLSGKQAGSLIISTALPRCAKCLTAGKGGRQFSPPSPRAFQPLPLPLSPRPKRGEQKGDTVTVVQAA